MIYLPGPFFGYLSGTAGSTLATRNLASGIIDVRRMPTYVSTPATSSTRGLLQAIANLWGTLTDSQVSAWQAYGITVVKVNALGVKTHLNAYQAFVAVQKRLFVIDVPPVLDPPIDVPPAMGITATLTVAGIVPGPSSMSVSYSPSVVPTGQNIVLASIRQGNPNRQSVSGPSFKNLAVLPAGATAPFDLASLYSPVWGDILTGYRYWVQLTIVTDTGLASTPIVVTAVAS